jgi:hypothetical protein
MTKPPGGKRVQVIVEYCRRSQVLCCQVRPENRWFEPSGLSCRRASARRAVGLGLVVPLSGVLLGDGQAQTYGVSPRGCREWLRGAV